jgi:hypothetical protein
MKIPVKVVCLAFFLCFYFKDRLTEEIKPILQAIFLSIVILCKPVVETFDGILSA